MPDKDDYSLLSAIPTVALVAELKKRQETENAYFGKGEVHILVVRE